MGLSSIAFERMLTFKERGLLKGIRSVVELGAQNIYLDDPAILTNFLRAFDRAALPEGQAELLAKGGAARDLYAALGLAHTSIDTSGEFGALPLDLNFDSVPTQHRGRYDFLTNFGTSEHVANQINCFQVAHDLTAPGGLMFHYVPFTGHQNHGLINYTPKFFWMLSRGNRYEFIDMHIHGVDSADPLHPDIKSLTTFNEGQWQTTRDSVILCLLRKTRDTPFVAPFDGHMHGLPDSVKDRYGDWWRDQPAPLARRILSGLKRRIVDGLTSVGLASPRR